MLLCVVLSYVLPIVIYCLANKLIYKRRIHHVPHNIHSNPFFGVYLVTDADFLGWVFVLGFMLMLCGIYTLIELHVKNFVEHQNGWVEELEVEKLKVGKLDAYEISADKIYLGRESWCQEAGSRVSLDKAGMIVYDATGKKEVRIHGYGVFVKDEAEDRHLELIPGSVTVIRYAPFGVGGRGAGGEARLYVSENGARVDVFDYGPYQWAVGLFANLDGARVSVYQDGGETEGRLKTLEQVLDDSGRDQIKVWAVDLRGDTNNGGSVNVYNWGTGYSEPNRLRASMGVNQYRNGAVSTWDKNDYRQ